MPHLLRERARFPCCARIDLTPPPRARPCAPHRLICAQDDMFLQLTMPLTTFDIVSVPYDKAGDGQEALDMCKDTKYAFVLMDNEMPNVSGKEAVKALRDRGFKGMIVGITGHAEGSDERNDFEAVGLDACVEKDSTGSEKVVELLKQAMATYA